MHWISPELGCGWGVGSTMAIDGLIKEKSNIYNSVVVKKKKVVHRVWFVWISWESIAGVVELRKRMCGKSMGWCRHDLSMSTIYPRHRFVHVSAAYAHYLLMCMMTKCWHRYVLMIGINLHVNCFIIIKIIIIIYMYVIITIFKKQVVFVRMYLYEFYREIYDNQICYDMINYLWIIARYLQQFKSAVSNKTLYQHDPKDTRLNIS